ncbi:alpha/beta fold hydrolase [Erythrobacter sp. HKB08]|uniref:alpha/beta fold hydrolase n=1 Tax=Erythrobacter sp. HKB08 TaxID=2502843 RepID=UPI0010086A47|nr:alpha/beta hydrolase [Erythrobacter sp. HKB08]
MAIKTSLLGGDTPHLSAEELSRRLALAREPEEEPAEKPKLRHLVGEFGWVFEPVRRQFRSLDIPQASSPQTVMLIPGFGAHPLRFRYLAKQLEQAGHKAKRWGYGFNLGPSKENLEGLAQRVCDLSERYDRKVVLVGWSLGGLFARELAKQHPDCVAKVVTMGSPFSGNPRANWGWRAYQFIAGHRVDEPPIANPIDEKPPVETVAFWSPRDGVVSPRSACGKPGERDRAVALRCTHMGFSFSHQCINAILQELEMD